MKTGFDLDQPASLDASAKIGDDGAGYAALAIDPAPRGHNDAATSTAAPPQPCGKGVA
jgi:hypothetical protein